MLNAFVAEVELNRSRVLAGVSEIEAGGVAQHVGMGREVNAARLGGLAHDVMRCAPRYRAAAQRGEHIRRSRIQRTFPRAQRT
jgi:hypothetical protein